MGVPAHPITTTQANRDSVLNVPVEGGTWFRRYANDSNHYSGD